MTPRAPNQLTPLAPKRARPTTAAVLSVCRRSPDSGINRKGTTPQTDVVPSLQQTAVTFDRIE